MQAFPGGGSKNRISIGGGTEPYWSADGQEIYYRNDDKMMVVSVDTDSEFSPSEPRLLFEGNYERNNYFARNYDVTADGSFLMVTNAQGGGDPSPPQITIAVNWLDELKGRGPAQ